MPNGKRLVLEHLEGVSWELLHEYPEVVRRLIRGRSGVYALYRRDRLYYVGLASNLIGRLKHHLGDRHRGSWDRFSIYTTVRHDHIKELESLLLRIVAPPGNRTGGRFVSSKNLYASLNRLTKEADADRRARVIGGHAAKRHRRRKATSATGSRALAGAFPRRTQLRGYYKGYWYYASLRTDGTISYAGSVYDSPAGAARAIVNRNVNGWAFWRYKKAGSGWVRLDTLRK